MQTAEGKYGYINRNGETVIAAVYDKALPFADNGLAAVCLSTEVGLWGYIDKSGSFCISPVYKSASSFSPNGLAAVSDENGYFYIDQKGSELIRLSGLRCGTRFMADGYAVVLCYSILPNELGLEMPILTHYEIIDEAGVVLLDQPITGLCSEHLSYAFTP